MAADPEHALADLAPMLGDFRGRFDDGIATTGGRLTAIQAPEMDASIVHTMTRKAAVSCRETKLCQQGFREFMTGITLDIVVASDAAQSASVVEY